jgi:ribose-phosphate pyrophosphokinase
MHLMLMADAMKRASARRITAVIPYFGYARQDRKAKSRDPISAKLVADLISVSGISRILTVDLHAAQIQGFFNFPVDHLVGAPTLAAYIKNSKGFNSEDYVVLSPDLGSIARARLFAARLGCPLAVIDKRRQRANVSEVMNIIGEAKGKKVLLVDDMVDTAGTICNAAKAITEIGGAAEVCVYATHSVLSGEAVNKLRESVIKKVVFLDTVPIPEEKMLDKFTVLSIAPLLAEAIKRLQSEESIAAIFDKEISAKK